MINAIMTASVITEFQQQFELLLNHGAPQDQKRPAKMAEQFHLSGCRSSTGVCSTATTPFRSARVAP